MNGYLSLSRHCGDCGATDKTVLVETELGDLLCRRCWAETTTVSVTVTTTPDLDRVLARGSRRKGRR